jgi:hypothetical protein
MPTWGRPEVTASGHLFARCGDWSADVEAAQGSSRASISLEGPALYLEFTVREPGVLARAARYLRRKDLGETFRLGEVGEGLQIDLALHGDTEALFLVVARAQPRCMAFRVVESEVPPLAMLLEQIWARLSRGSN